MPAADATAAAEWLGGEHGGHVLPESVKAALLTTFGEEDGWSMDDVPQGREDEDVDTVSETWLAILDDAIREATSKAPNKITVLRFKRWLRAHFEDVDVEFGLSADDPHG